VGSLLQPRIGWIKPIGAKMYGLLVRHTPFFHPSRKIPQKFQSFSMTFCRGSLTLLPQTMRDCKREKEEMFMKTWHALETTVNP
jgi:hypothetical protein